MNLWSHRFSQNMNKKLSELLPSLHRAEILTIFRLYFGRNDDFINSFWNCLTFSIYNPAVVIRTYVGILVCINSMLGCVRKICIVAKTVRCQLLFGSQLSLQVKDTKAKPFLWFSHLILTYFNPNFSAFHISALA